MTSVQPDLFGEYDAEQERAAARAALRPRWRAWLQAEPRPVPWNTQGGLVEGEISDDWWRCPGCGAVEFGAYSFWLSHGFHPDYVGDVPWAWESHGGCHRTIRTRSPSRPGPGSPVTSAAGASGTSGSSSTTRAGLASTAPTTSTASAGTSSRPESSRAKPPRCRTPT